MWDLKSKKPEQRENLQDKKNEQNKKQNKTKTGNMSTCLKWGIIGGTCARLFKSQYKSIQVVSSTAAY